MHRRPGVAAIVVALVVVRRVCPVVFRCGPSRIDNDYCPLCLPPDKRPNPNLHIRIAFGDIYGRRRRCRRIRRKGRGDRWMRIEDDVDNDDDGFSVVANDDDHNHDNRE